MSKHIRLDTILQGGVFTSLFVSTILLMNIVERPIFGLLIGIIGVLTYRLMVLPSDAISKFMLQFSLLPSIGELLFIVHLLVIPIWLLVPASPSLYFLSWAQITPDLLLRAIVTISYTCVVPGTFLVVFLDRRNQLTLLEVFILGVVSSLSFSSLLGYSLYSVGLNLTLFELPTLWVFSSLFLGLRFATRFHEGWLKSTVDRPPSFTSGLTLGILLSTVITLVLGVLVVNVKWYALVGGDLWTHAAQTAYFLQGNNAITYPWAFHFLVASLWGVSGLPIVNVEQVLQVFTILPVLALYVTITAYSERYSKVPILATLFFGLFMGLGWVSYLYLKITLAPSTLVGLYNIENGASIVTYDIAYGILGIRTVFIPAILALSCLILVFRQLRSFTFPWVSLIIFTMILTFLSTASHLVETGFFVAVLLIASIMRGELDELTTLFFCEFGAALALGILFALDWLSPTSQRIFTSPVTTNFYSSAFSDEAYLVLLALFVTLLKTIMMKRGLSVSDVLNWVYSRLERYAARVEARFISMFLILTGLLGVLFTVYTLRGPLFTVWDVVSSASVPWNFYPIRLGVVTFFAFVGSAIIILHLETIKRYFEFFVLAAIAIAVGRLIDLFGARPFNFGENRIMDILWVAVTPLAGFGVVDLALRLPKHFKLRNETRKVLAAVALMLILFAGTASFLLLIDKVSLQGQIPGYAATRDDMRVISYIIQHRNSLAGSLTAPTLLTQFKIREMTLTYPVGYFLQSSVLPFFQSSTIAGVFRSVSSVLGTNIFVSGYDVSYLSENNYLPVLWFLAYQPASVDAKSSFLLSPLQMNSAAGSSNSLAILFTGGESLTEFYGTSALAFLTPNYSLGNTNTALPSSTSYILLPNDPSDSAVYDSTLAWAKASGRTLVVVSNSDTPGLFESQLFKSREVGINFTASQIQSIGGGSSTQTMLPVPLTIRELKIQNATTLASYENGTNGSPLASVVTVGSGHVILLSVRDYYGVLSQNMFNEIGRALFRFLPNVIRTANLPLSP